MASGGTSGRGTSQASRLSTITSRNSSTTNAHRRTRRRLTLTPTNRVSQSGQRRLPATEMPQYGQCLSIVPPGHDLVGYEMRGYNLSIGPDVRKRYRIVKFRQHLACLRQDLSAPRWPCRRC